MWPRLPSGVYPPAFVQRERKLLRNKEMSCRAQQKSEGKSNRAARSGRRDGDSGPDGYQKKRVIGEAKGIVVKAKG